LAPEASVGFVQAARLELDVLLEQLVERAHEVQDTQGRLRGLLGAYREVVAGVELDSVLRHVVDSARTLVNARYAALGLIREDRLTRFLHSGMDDETVRAIGHPPEGKGLLGLLITNPQTLRLSDIADHPASIGFPDRHPPMRSFLGVPIRIGDRGYGNLYLTDKQGSADFSPDDEQLVTALAAIAGTAIENATFYQEAKRRQQWQTTLVQVTSKLLRGDDHDDVLRHLLIELCQAVDGAGASVTLPTDDPTTWQVVITHGTLTTWQDAPVATDSTLSGIVIAERTLTVVNDPSTDERIAAATNALAGLGPTAAAPMISAEHVAGVIAVARRPGGDPFDQLDRELITAAAAQAGLALSLAAARIEAEELRQAQGREQIAIELQHTVIERLFKHVLALQGIASRTTHDTTRTAIQAQIDEVDAIIADIRRAAFNLHAQMEPSAADTDHEAD
jgi:GAF domain-containing protein